MVEPLRLRELLERLVEGDVRFILVGGLAVDAWGYLRATRDIDVVPDPSPENLEKLDVLLQTPRLRMSTWRGSQSEFVRSGTCSR